MPQEPNRQGGGPTPEKGREQSPWALAGLGAQFLAAILLSVYGGNWLDARFETSPLFLLLGLFVGGGGSFILSYRRLTAADRDAQKDSRRDDHDGEGGR